jgi:hypothetical protein
MSRYTKAWAALLAGLIVAVPAFQAAQSDGVSLGEWLTILGLFVPAVVSALAPANKLTTGELVDQIDKNPDVQLKSITASPDITK